MRHIVIGDIHGCLDEFNELVKLVNYSKGTDDLILVGDLIDRGPDSPGVIRRARELGARCVRANHEESALRYRKHEALKLKNPNYVNPMRPRHPDRLAQWAAVSDDDWNWVDSLPPYIKFCNNWVAVHAGARAGILMKDQAVNELIRIRYVHNLTGKMVPLSDTGEAGSECHPWYEDWAVGPATDEQNIVYGHHVYDQVNIQKTGTALTVGIDTGCCFGGHLTALVLHDDNPNDDLTFVSVPAKQPYADLKAAWTKSDK